jgi:small neutral amino acid transporter SnatA (MarC family)
VVASDPLLVAITIRLCRLPRWSGARARPGITGIGVLIRLMRLLLAAFAVQLFINGAD